MTLFTFHPGNTFLHTMDVRCKSVLVCILSLTMFNAGLYENLLFLFISLSLLKLIGISFLTILRQLKWFLLFLIFIFLSQSLSAPGDPIFSLFGMQISRYGLLLGSKVAIGFLNIMLIGLIFTSTTRIMEIKAAFQWFLKPIPFVPEKRVATIIGLAIKFMPMLLDNAREVNYAVNARCGNLRKNPVYRITNKTWPLIRKTFSSADNLDFAMQSRCYNENRTNIEFHSNGKEFFILALVIILSISSILL